MTAFVIGTGNEMRPVAGLDSMIATVPDELYVTMEGKRTLIASRLRSVLRQLSASGAADLGELLHHAEWTITGDPDVVRRIGETHDCVRCRASTDQAVTYLREQPGKELLVGVLYWAEP